MSLKKSWIEATTGTAIRGVVNWSISWPVYPMVLGVAGGGIQYLELTAIFTVSSVVVGTAVTHAFNTYEKRSKLHRLAKMERLIEKGKSK